jgi:hypothetical protein
MGLRPVKTTRYTITDGPQAHPASQQPVALQRRLRATLLRLSRPLVLPPSPRLPTIPRAASLLLRNQVGLCRGALFFVFCQFPEFGVRTGGRQELSLRHQPQRASVRLLSGNRGLAPQRLMTSMIFFRSEQLVSHSTPNSGNKAPDTKHKAPNTNHHSQTVHNVKSPPMMDRNRSFPPGFSQ